MCELNTPMQAFSIFIIQFGEVSQHITYSDSYTHGIDLHTYYECHSVNDHEHQLLFIEQVKPVKPLLPTIALLRTCA